jgi:hypothetical protein
LESPAAGNYPVRFFRCVEAAAQPGRVALTSAPQGRLTVEHADGLQRLWNDGGESSPLAQWGFDPAQTSSLVVRLATAQELRQLLRVERASLETRLTRQHLIHTVAYSVANQHAQALALHLPADCELDEVLVDGRRVESRLAAKSQQPPP